MKLLLSQLKMLSVILLSITALGSFFLLFGFAIYKMVDSEHNMKIYKCIISIEAVMKNSEMLKVVPDHHKTKKIGRNVVKTYYLFLIDIRLNKCVIMQF